MKKNNIITDASFIYKSPLQLHEDKTLSLEIKILALENWRQDILLLLVADEENMHTSNDYGYLLSEISNILLELRA